MTVRWKPLIVLSGLFSVIAVMGLLAITYAMPGRAEDRLPRARASAKAGKYDDALIHYRRALQVEPKAVAIHEEMAEMIGGWIDAAPKRRGELRVLRNRALRDAAKYGKGRAGPRQKLLADALAQDDLVEALAWADELLPIDPKSPDAHYVKALEGLDIKKPADLASAKEHLAVLAKAEPARDRTLWVRARVARASNDAAALAEALRAAREAAPEATSSGRLARLRLRTMEVTLADDPAALEALVAAFRDEARVLADEPDPSPSRIRVLNSSLEEVQFRLKAVAAQATASDSKERLTALGEALESVAEAIYARALETSGASDLRAHLSYVEHLLFRDRPDKCLEAASRALKLPIAKLPLWDGVAAGLREAAVKAALSREDDPNRFENAMPFVRDLAASPNPRFAGMGQFFQGLIALERSGLTAAAAREPGDEAPTPVDPKLRDAAVTALKKAAAALPDSSTTQALYGVALILTGEPGLGRQYLQAAYRLGGEEGLEPRYQVWAAWSIVQAGYPEEAEPIVAKLLAGVAKGDLPRELSRTLHLLKAEIHQARRSPEQLRMARDEFAKAVAEGQPLTPALQLRLAQIDLQLGDRAQGMGRLAKLKGDPAAGPSAERLAVLGLRKDGKPNDAAARLAEARALYPDSDELAELDAVLHAESDDADGADRILADYLAKHPGRVELAMVRARLLAPKRPEEARKVLLGLAEKAETSAPLVQLALLDLGRKQPAEAARTIAKIRDRWKEAAVADLLDAQLSLAGDDPQAAAKHLDAALKKDPNNKVALFWKALLDERSGAKAKASQALESILKDQPVKEIDDNLSLATAARWALADMALQNQDLDVAIGRFEGLLKEREAGELNRSVRWKLVAAHAAKGEVAQAKAEVARLVAEPGTTHEERVRAADFYRRQGEEAACLAQLDRVLKADPSHAGAVAYKALALAAQEKPDEASALLRKAIASGRPPTNLYLMLAAAENLRKPRDKAPARALAALEEGLAKHPGAVELVQAKYQVLKLLRDPGAVAYVEGVAKADPSPAARRVLAEVYREEGQLARAEALARELMKETPKDASLAAALVGLVARQSEIAAEAGDRASAKGLDAKALELIRKYRGDFPTDLTFPQAECELALRQGDAAKARRLCGEIAAMDPASPVGPLLRARMLGGEGKAEEVARAYEEALGRSPRRTDIRLALAQANLALGKADEALKQTSFVLDGERNQPTALLLKAQALASQPGTDAERAARRAEAAKSLRDAIAANPNFLEAYHLLAELRFLEGDRAKGLNALREGLKVNPNDDTGLAALVQSLCEPRHPGETVPPADVREAMKLAEEFGGRDERGAFALALAVGFQRARRYDLALPWAEKAAQKIDRPVVHQAYGDILLGQAEATTDDAQARPIFARAVEQYDAVLKKQPGSIEAVNNKAWVLHRHLDRNFEALELAEGLTRRADPSALPAEFYDTLGSICEAMGEPKKAEDAYAKGLRKAPGHASLNYHMGKLLASDRSRADRAAGYLAKASEGKARLSPEVAGEVETLLKTVQR